MTTFTFGSMAVGSLIAAAGGLGIFLSAAIACIILETLSGPLGGDAVTWSN
jgi:hypothetical protein